jgi:hypothetical protein
LRGTTKVCLIIGIVFAVASLAWMVFLPALVERELREATGFEFRVAVLKADPFTGRVVVRGLSARNPPRYPSPDFVELRELRADVNEFSWLFSDHVVINELDVDTAKIELIRQHDGTSTAGDFISALSRGGASAPAAAAPTPRARRQYLVKRLHVRLEELVVADYTGSKLDEKVYKLNIDQSYTNVSDPKQLIVPQVVKTLYSFGLHHDVAKLLPGEFGEALAAAVGGAAHVGSAVKSVVEKTGESLKGAFDKLEQSPKP